MVMVWLNLKFSIVYKSLILQGPSGDSGRDQVSNSPASKSTSEVKQEISSPEPIKKQSVETITVQSPHPDIPSRTTGSKISEFYFRMYL